MTLTNTTTKQTVNEKIIKQIKSDLINEVPVDVYMIQNHIDIKDKTGLAEIYKIVIGRKIITKHEWDILVSKKIFMDDFNAKYPENPMEFIEAWVKRYEMKMDYKGNIKSKHFRSTEVKNLYVQLEGVDKLASETSDVNLLKNYKRETRVLLDTIKSSEQNITTDVILRKIRISRDTYKLKFSDSQLADSIDEWTDNFKALRRGQIFSSIMFCANDYEIKKADEQLETVCKALFNSNYVSVNVSKNIIKKFIWQVKRKAKGEHITNHIMPVFTGPQGVGKSTLMYNLIEPMSELSAPTDFKQLTDDRNISLFKNLILVMDEMGHADKSDIESVKSIMTAPTLSRRPMRQNNNVNIRQDATLIGASNKEIEQLIRDETGIRRFFGIRFKVNPDWDAVKNVDWYAIWQSVDEDASDPTLEVMEEIKEIQESSRCKTPCESWVKTLKEKDNAEKSGSNWFSQYKTWESLHYTRRSMEYDAWARELRRLIATHEYYPFSFKVNGSVEMFTLDIIDDE